MLEAYRRDGSLEARKAFARQMGNHRTDPNLLQATQARLQRLAGSAPDGRILPLPPSAWRGMPTKGAVKLFVLLVDFSDYPHNDILNPTASVQARVFGDGDSAAAAPYESLRNFYRRASYNQLDFSGTVLGWYRPGYTRASVANTAAGRDGLIKEALRSFETQGHDFAQYDNDGDGSVDYFAVVWSGPDNGWSNFWWGYQTFFSDASFKVSGKSLWKYSWQWESRPAGGAFKPLTLIHETGHALGLPDYYDYDDTVGPKGGLGGLDMMDGNWGDHNCFSKFLLDWITPEVITGAVTGATLAAAEASPGEAKVLMPTAVPGQPFGEFFMLQNRTRTQNDSGYPADGLLIWHVDSRLDPSGGNVDYRYDNSFTEHKLLKLMEADGLEQIETSGSRAHAGDYYQSGKVFGPLSTPASVAYDGLQSWLEVRNLSAPGSPVTFDVAAIAPDGSAPTGAPGQPTAAGNLDTLTLSWSVGTAADPESGITGYSVQIGTTSGGSEVFDGRVGPATLKAFPGLGRFEGQPLYARVRAMNGAGLFSAWSPSSAPLTLSLPALPCSVLDACPLVFKSLGPWSEDTTTQTLGGSSAKSAPIPDNGTSSLQTWVQGPGTLSFQWKVSSEGGFDFLRFNVDGQVPAGVAPISGEVPWSLVTLSLPAGAHFLQWIYSKDGGANSGSDAAWVDQVQWVPDAPAGSPDVNADGILDLRDLLAFARQYGTAGPAGDLNGDGRVDDLDLGLLLGAL
jgi:M6 family metalloprotease-like protein